MSDEFKKEREEEKSYESDSKGSDELKNLFRDLKREIRDEFKDLREELYQARGNATERRNKIYDHRRTRKREKDFRFDSKPIKDWGENIGSSLERYIGSILESVWDSVDQSVGSLFQTPSSSGQGRKKRYREQKKSSISEEELEDFYLRGSELLSALSDQKRLRMLKELEKEPLRQSALSEKTDIKGGNFKHHISILKDEGLVRQEGVRERYMLTFAGREALKLAEFLYHRAKKKPTGVTIVIDDKDTESNLEEE